ncbi:hypothetical protein GHK39_03890 [Sinorhizobium medicae]|uniref:hypothetical protein n=1 Tax=Sinorhizobium medicae TaxID=110321 RepID=UPI0012978B5B|nr:hypothetical protein [Sinorhizobium medicae]MQV83825.1 hypothetical protein [Sinorhizobium medicae]MQV95436.1 hypothetical protein [Sinorhizobium medicae]
MPFDLRGLIDSLKDEECAEVEVIDFEGDFLLPGLIDIHTDNMEHYLQPRPGVRWPSTLAAVLWHDWQLLGT